MTLSDYLVYIGRGSDFNPEDYYQDADAEGDLDIESTVNTSEAGTYYVDYTVSAGNMSGKSRLVVVVN